MSKQTPRNQYLDLIQDRIDDVSVRLIIEWINNRQRKPAELSFTEGPARQLAYAIEAALKYEQEHMRGYGPPLRMRLKEACPRCFFTRFIED